MSAVRIVLVILWLAFAVLIAAVLWVVLAACGLAWFGGRPMLVFCPIPVAARQVDPAIAAEQERQRALQSSIRDLEIALLDRPYCTAQQDEPCPQPEPSEVVLVLDASLSMGWDFDPDPAIEQWLDEFRQRWNAFRAREEQRPSVLRSRPEAQALERERQALVREFESLKRQIKRPEKIDRIDVAKEALTEVVRASPDHVDFAFVSFNTCGAPRRLGRFTPERRGRLLNRIDRLELGSSTALADAIDILPQVMRGGQSEEEPVNVVLVSDGVDSCGGDPCAAATALKTAAPHAYVNVIAIGLSAEEVRCVAEATGGIFVRAGQADALARQLAYAAGQDLPEHCR